MEINISKQAGVMISVNERDKTHWVELSNITHLTCNGYVSTLHFAQNEQITLCKLLKQFEDMLAPYGFMRANRQTLVNPGHVKHYLGGSKRHLVLSNGNSVEVSRRKAYLFKPD